MSVAGGLAIGKVCYRDKVVQNFIYILIFFEYNQFFFFLIAYMYYITLAILWCFENFGFYFQQAAFAYDGYDSQNMCHIWTPWKYTCMSLGGGYSKFGTLKISMVWMCF